MFERNERFWGKKPLLRRIEYTLYRAVDLRAQWQDFTHGNGDSARPYISVSDSDTSSIAQARTLPGIVLQQVPDLTLQYLAINWKYAPFDDMRVRQAFSLALDRQAIEHEISLDTSQPTIHLAPEGMPGYNLDLTNAAGRKGKNALTPDLTAARALLRDYAAEKCGGSETRCPQVLISGYEGAATQSRLVTLLASQWRDAFPLLTITTQLMEDASRGASGARPPSRMGGERTIPIPKISSACYGHTDVSTTSVM